MPLEKTNTLVVGGGQAGLAMSAHLRRAGVDHIVLAHDASLIVAQVKRAYRGEDNNYDNDANTADCRSGGVAGQ